MLLEGQEQDNLGCTVKRPDDNLDMYVFDPFNHIIQEEYLKRPQGIRMPVVYPEMTTNLERYIWWASLVNAPPWC